MQIKMIKQIARQQLKLNWYKYFFINLLGLVIFGPLAILGFIFGVIPGIVILSFAVYASVHLSLHLLDGNPLHIQLLFDVQGRAINIIRTVLLQILIGFLIIFPFILALTLLKESIWVFILYPIVYLIELYISIRMSFSVYLVRDFNLGALDAVTESFILTQGNVIKITLFFLSFFGWFMILPLTFGLLSCWLIPYMQVSFAKLYQTLSREENEYLY